MGKRLLRSWMLRPSIEVAEINARLDAVEAQVNETVAREELRRALDGILDLERSAQPSNAGDGESPRCARSGRVAEKDSGASSCTGEIRDRTAEDAARVA